MHRRPKAPRPAKVGDDGAGESRGDHDISELQPLVMKVLVQWSWHAAVTSLYGMGVAAGVDPGSLESVHRPPDLFNCSA